MNKTKIELLDMSAEELEIERKLAWKYYKKVQAVEEFLELED